MTSCNIRFPLEFSEYQLLEIPDDEFLANAMDPHHRIYFKGEATDEAVLCTSETTYAVRLAETSNTMLGMITSTCKDHGASVELITSQYLELSRTVPRTRRLLHLLSQDMYRGPHHPSTTSATSTMLYTFSHLLNVVQCSEHELTAALASLFAVTLDGYQRLLHPTYIGRCLELIHAALLSQGLSYDEPFTLALIIDNIEPHHLEDYPTYLIQHVLSMFTRDTSPANIAIPTHLYHISPDKLIQFRVRELFTLKSVWPLKEALAVLTHCLPEEWHNLLTISSASPLPSALRKALQGIALVTANHTNPHAIPTTSLHSPVSNEENTSLLILLEYFPAEATPLPPKERFAFLFDRRPKWTLPDLQPYLIDLLPDPTNVSHLEALLHKHTRISYVNQDKLYSRRI